MILKKDAVFQVISSNTTSYLKLMDSMYGTEQRASLKDQHGGKRLTRNSANQTFPSAEDTPPQTL